MATKARLRDAKAYETNLLDPINLRLLEELRTDGRLTVAELGRRISMSAPAVAERVQRLERAGVITGYHAELDPRALGFPISAFAPRRVSWRRFPRSRATRPRSRSATGSRARTATCSSSTSAGSRTSKSCSTGSRPTG
jgi:hypothetical protein